VFDQLTDFWFIPDGVLGIREEVYVLFFPSFLPLTESGVMKECPCVMKLMVISISYSIPILIPMKSFGCSPNGNRGLYLDFLRDQENLWSDGLAIYCYGGQGAGGFLPRCIVLVVSRYSRCLLMGQRWWRSWRSKFYLRPLSCIFALALASAPIWSMSDFVRVIDMLESRPYEACWIVSSMARIGSDSRWCSYFG